MQFRPTAFEMMACGVDQLRGDPTENKGGCSTQRLDRNCGGGGERQVGSADLTFLYYCLLYSTEVALPFLLFLFFLIQNFTISLQIHTSIEIDAKNSASQFVFHAACLPWAGAVITIVVYVLLERACPFLSAVCRFLNFSQHFLFRILIYLERKMYSFPEITTPQRKKRHRGPIYLSEIFFIFWVPSLSPLPLPALHKYRIVDKLHCRTS